MSHQQTPTDSVRFNNATETSHSSSQPAYYAFRERPFSYLGITGACITFFSIVIHDTVQGVLRRPQSNSVNLIAVSAALGVFLVSLRRIRRSGLFLTLLVRWRMFDAALWTLALVATYHLIFVIAIMVLAYLGWHRDFGGTVPFVTFPGFRWFIALLIGLPVVAVSAACFRRWTQKAVRRHSNRCVKCVYDLTGNASGRCPECGTPTGPPATP